jgi:hypothetical protein
LDISSSITGIVLMDKDGTMLFMGHIPLLQLSTKTFSIKRMR